MERQMPHAQARMAVFPRIGRRAAQPFGEIALQHRLAAAQIERMQRADDLRCGFDIHPSVELLHDPVDGRLAANEFEMRPGKRVFGGHGGTHAAYSGMASELRRPSNRFTLRRTDSMVSGLASSDCAPSCRQLRVRGSAAESQTTAIVTPMMRARISSITAGPCT